MKQKEKSLNVKLYALVAFLAVAAALVLIVVFTFKSRYPAFHPQQVAAEYVDTIVQTGDGYNAYKTSLVSKNYKYGDFIRANYMNPIIYREAGYKPGDSTKNLKGFNDKSYMGEKTVSDDGSLQGQLNDAMYDYYLELTAGGWDNYDKIFTDYFNRLVEVRRELYGDDYMTDSIMFSALESNVMRYGKSLTGTETVIDKNTNKELSHQATGLYETAFGEDYRLICTANEGEDISLDAYLAETDGEALKAYKVENGDISAAKKYTVTVKNQKDEEVARTDITVVKIGSSWYVDNTKADTSALYSFCK